MLDVPGIGAGGVWGPCARGVGAAGALPGWHGEGVVWVLCHMNRAMRPWLWGPCAGTHGRGGSLGLLFPWGTQEPPLAAPLGCAAMSLP